MHGTVERDGCAPWHGTFANVWATYKFLTHSISHLKCLAIWFKSVGKLSLTYHVVVFPSGKISRADNSNKNEACLHRNWLLQSCISDYSRWRGGGITTFWCRRPFHEPLPLFRLGLLAAGIPEPDTGPAEECRLDGRWWRDSLMHPQAPRVPTGIPGAASKAALTVLSQRTRIEMSALSHSYFESQNDVTVDFYFKILQTSNRLTFC